MSNGISEARSQGTFTLNGSSQAGFARNLARNGLIISVNGAAAGVWLVFQTNASVAPTASVGAGLFLANGATLSLVDETNFTGAIAVIGTNTQTFTWVEF